MKFYLENYGCKLNEADSEIIKGLLSENHEEVFDFSLTDFIILNTCGVIDKTEKKIIERTLFLKNKGKKVFWTGCLPLITKNNVSDGSIGPNNLSDINKMIKEENHFFNNIKEDKSLFREYKKRKEGISATVAISEGCLGNCSYCGSKFARKGLYSFPKQNILKEIEDVLDKGALEILLTSQGLATYGLDRGKQELPELIDEILKIKKDFRLKLGMMSPKFAKNIINDFNYKDKKLYNFLHLPLQSGDNTLLREMNRGYTVEDFIDICLKMRSLSEDFVLATDIIVGHPKEDEKAFKNTIKVIEEIKPDILHVFRYSKREGTEDSKLKEIDSKIKKQRSTFLVDLYHKQNLEKNKDFLGKEFEVLVIEKTLARTNSGRAVVIKNGKMGEFIKVKISGYTWNYLIGE